MIDPRTLQDKPSLTIVGLMSGTSMDGIDAVVTEISGPADAPVFRQLGFVTVPYKDKLRAALRDVSGGEVRSAGDLCALDHAVGDAFGQAALAALRAADIPADRVDLVGSHGQTVFHDASRSETWQIGEASRIAAAVGAPVVSDFRRADQAAGGQGAPLVPLFDALVFRHPKRGRALVNIGGIANVTVLPAGRGREGIFAFDTGPGNVLIDEFLMHATSGRVAYDADGKLAAAGTVDEDLLAAYLEHPYFYEKPPKSTGREVFGAGFVALTLGEWGRRGDRIEDATATLTDFTALSIAGSIREYVQTVAAVEEVLVSGGGSHNQTLMKRITEELDDLTVAPLESVGFSSDAKEALAFALLARETIFGRAGNIPTATGARQSVVLGSVTPALTPWGDGSP
ncbi:MAG: anhydro-N-acetylmuramic acid kinase [Gemmatimonadota bacterium]|nr:MAG: anhydro-N-acetylmuramic acid kinase [Gemmatimonadota bacterium]